MCISPWKLLVSNEAVSLIGTSLNIACSSDSATKVGDSLSIVIADGTARLLLAEGDAVEMISGETVRLTAARLLDEPAIICVPFESVSIAHSVSTSVFDTLKK